MVEHNGSHENGYDVYEARRRLEDERAADNDIAGVTHGLDPLVATEHRAAHHSDPLAHVVY